MDNPISVTHNADIMFDINDTDTSYYNKAMKIQTLIVMCLVHDDELST